MRRGTPRGRGNNRPMQRPQNQNPRQSPGAPLMTGHLLGLKDIDMELELLKRKREIIEQQQHILSNTSYRQRNDYEQPQYSQSRDNRYDDYTSLYDNPRESYPYGGGAPSRKRPHIQVWENETPPKRFSAPSRGVKKAFGSRLGPPPNTSRPEFHHSAPKPFKQRPHIPNPPPKKKEFTPSKVTKPSGGAPPPAAKLSSYQPAERKKLVAATLASSGATVRAAPAPAGSDAWILRADCEPSRQINGRLELALGSIMKELKLAHPESEELFRQPVSMRAMKQAVRERIRTAMIGNVVSTSENIQATYYEMFPSTDDEHVVLRGLEAQKGCEFITIKADDPETYFKRNMHRLMGIKLEEMTNKLEQLYNGNNSVYTPKKRYRQHQGKNKAGSKPCVESKPEAVSKPDDAQPQADADQPKTEADADQPKTEADADQPKTEADESKTDEPQATDDVQAETDNVQAQTDEVTLKPDEDQPNAEEVPVPIEEQAKPDETQAKPDVSQAKSAEEPPKVSNKDTLTPPPELVNTEQYKAFDRLMSFKIIHLIKKFSPAFLKIMDIDQMYRKTKGVIFNEARKKLLGNTEGYQQTPQNAAKTGATETSEKRFLQPLPYHAKILGKPSLPKRKAMESFFSQFNPQFVKKHRTIHNLLFVGFVDKESFDKILDANGTVIGRFTLDIKISERSYDKKNQGNGTADDSLASTEDDASTVKLDESASTVNLNESVSEILSSDLDDQITDLLSSIRKSEQDSISDDVVIVEPPTGDKDDVKIQNGDQTVEIKSDVAVEQSEVKDEPIKTEESIENAADVKDDQNDEDIIEIKDVPSFVDLDSVQAAENDDAEKKDAVAPLKTEVKATPSRASARLATPGGIKTRRMSKLE